jgi:hypothetical protein
LGAAGLVWVLAWVLVGAGRWCRWRWAAWLAPLVVLGVCCLGAAGTEQATSYHPDLAVAIADAEVSRLPEVASTIPGRLAVGDHVRILEARDGWCRVRRAGGDGWVPARAVVRLLAP